MPVIDVHTHVFSDDLAPIAIPALEAQGDFKAFYDGTVSGLLREMDVAGVDISVVQPVATKPSQVVSINNWVASIASERIVPFGAMHPDFQHPAEEIARMASLGLKGFKLHPEHQVFDPRDPRLFEVYRAAVEHNLIVFFHAGEDEVHPGAHSNPERFCEVLDSWPDLTVVLAHLGGYQQWEEVAERLVGRDVWLDTAYTPRQLPDEQIIKLVRAHGAERVLFGSDGPWTKPDVEIAHLRTLDFTPAELEGILGGNAARLLALH